jgi:hypothetical protein
LSETFLILKRIQRDININVHRSLCKSTLYSCQVLIKLLDRFSKNTQISSSIKIRAVGAELYNADRQTDGRTDMTKLIIVFHNFAGVSKMFYYWLVYMDEQVLKNWLLRKLLGRNTRMEKIAG